MRLRLDGHLRLLVIFAVAVVLMPSARAIDCLPVGRTTLEDTVMRVFERRPTSVAHRSLTDDIADAFERAKGEAHPWEQFTVAKRPTATRSFHPGRKLSADQSPHLVRLDAWRHPNQAIADAAKNLREDLRGPFESWIEAHLREVSLQSPEAYRAGFMDAVEEFFAVTSTGTGSAKSPHLGHANYAKGYGEFHALLREPSESVSHTLAQRAEPLAQAFVREHARAQEIQRVLADASDQLAWVKRAKSMRRLRQLGFDVETVTGQHWLRIDVPLQTHLRGRAYRIPAGGVHRVPLTSAQAESWSKLLAERDAAHVRGVTGDILSVEERMVKESHALAELADAQIVKSQKENERLLARFRTQPMRRLASTAESAGAKGLSLNQIRSLFDFVEEFRIQR